MALIANVDWGWFDAGRFSIHDVYQCDDHSCARVAKTWAYSDANGTSRIGAYPVYRRLCYEHFFAAGKYETISRQTKWEGWRHGHAWRSSTA